MNASSDLHEVSFRSDRPGLLMRQVLLRLANAEQTGRGLEKVA